MAASRVRCQQGQGGWRTAARGFAVAEAPTLARQARRPDSDLSTRATRTHPPAVVATEGTRWSGCDQGRGPGPCLSRNATWWRPRAAGRSLPDSPLTRRGRPRKGGPVDDAIGIENGPDSEALGTGSFVRLGRPASRDQAIDHGRRLVAEQSRPRGRRIRARGPCRAMSPGPRRRSVRRSRGSPAGA